MELRGFLLRNNNEKWQFLYASLIAILIIIPIILNVHLYFDDFGRSLKGTYEWSGDGRPLAEYLYRKLSLDSEYSALSRPLGLLLCIPLIAYSSIFLCRIFSNSHRWSASLAALFFFGQPYFVENLSYSYDSPLMCLAICLSLYSAYAISSNSSKYSFLLAVVFTLSSLSIYQPANTAFWIPVLFLVFSPSSSLLVEFSGCKIEDFASQFHAYTLRRLNILSSLFLCQLIVFLSYKIFILPNLILESYTKNYSAIAPFASLPQSILSNSFAYLNIIYNDWASTPFGSLYISLLLFSIVGKACLTYANFSSLEITPKQLLRIVVCLCLGLLAVCLIFVFSYGVGVVLQRPVFPPRTFIGIGAFISSAVLCATSDISFQLSPQNIPYPLRKRLFDVFLLVILSTTAWSYVFIQFSYASAYSRQEALNRYFIETIVQELRYNGYGFNELNEISIKGSSPFSPLVLQTFTQLPYLKSMIRPIRPIPIDWLGHVRFKHYGFRPLKPSTHLDNAQVLVSNPVYDLSVERKRLIIFFKG